MELETRPKPSREALLTILGGHCNQIELVDQLCDKLMAWATGEVPCCPHLRRGADGVWNWVGHVRFVGHEPRYCPECGVKKPI